jgi:hypothetical protein
VNDFDSTSIFVHKPICLMVQWLGSQVLMFKYLNFAPSPCLEVSLKVDIAQKKRKILKNCEKNCGVHPRSHEKPMVFPWFSHENPPFRSGNWESLAAPGRCGARQRAGGECPC